MQKNKFISIEGIEGAGKSTAIAFIADYFTDRKLEFVLTREPGGTEIAEEIRSILLNPNRYEKLLPQTELLLMFASRAQLINSKIKPALRDNKWVICDRFVDASYAYQGGGRQIDMDKIAELDAIVVGEWHPSLTLLLDVTPDVGHARARTREDDLDRIENEDTAFFERVRNVYLERAKADPERFRIIDAAKSLDDVKQQIESALVGYLS